MEKINQRKIVRDYVGTAGHLYWLITGNHHPKCECSVCQLLDRADQAYEEERDRELVQI